MSGNGRSRKYEQHLRSDYWRAIRAAALADADYQCSLCPRREQLDVHHRSYKNLGHETLKDVNVLCRECHNKHHGPSSQPRLVPTTRPAPKNITPAEWWDEEPGYPTLNDELEWE